MDESINLPLKDSTKKLAMLVTLTTAQKGAVNTSHGHKG